MQTVFALIAAAALLYVLWRKYVSSHAAAAALPRHLFRDVLPLLAEPDIEAGGSAGSWKLTGRYEGEVFQLQTVVDTLVTRKLPSLWLLITLPRPQNITHVIDLMMRPSSASTFSKFDFLPHTLPTPPGFPEAAVIRSDSPVMHDLEFLRPHLDLFRTPKGKELLVSPKGLRIVLQAAEADRARYGVLREANFGDRIIAAAPVHAAMDNLLAIQEALNV